MAGGAHQGTGEQMRGGWLACAALAAAGLAACRQDPARGAIPRQRFVLANAALRSVPDTAAAGDSLRAAALKKYRVTEKDLMRFVQVNGRRAEYMSNVWREVADSVQKRYERVYLAGRPQDLPPGMAAPGADGRLDFNTTVPPQPVGRPPVVQPPGPPPTRGVQPRDRPRRPRAVPPPAGTVPPVPPRREPPVRTPAPPTDRRPMRPPGDTLKRTLAP
jgi:hypothetical protein